MVQFGPQKTPYVLRPFEELHLTQLLDEITLDVSPRVTICVSRSRKPSVDKLWEVRDEFGLVIGAPETMDLVQEHFGLQIGRQVERETTGGTVKAFISMYCATSTQEEMKEREELNQAPLPESILVPMPGSNLFPLLDRLLDELANFWMSYGAMQEAIFIASEGQMPEDHTASLKLVVDFVPGKFGELQPVGTFTYDSNWNCIDWAENFPYQTAIEEYERMVIGSITRID